MMDVGQLRELDPAVQAVYDQHMQAAIRPIDPIAELQRVTGTEGEDWFATQQTLRERFEQHRDDLKQKAIDPEAVAAASFLVNILTEDNLPHYVKRIETAAQHTESLAVWLGQWTAEEHPHGVIMRDYALSTRLIAPTNGSIDSTVYHEGVTSQLQSGTEVELGTVARGFAYLTLQEILTYLAHQRVGQLLDPAGQQIMWKIAGNESRHHRVYAQLARTMLELHPDETMVAIRDVFFGFEMPGQLGIPHYNELATTIAIGGIFGADDILEQQRKIIDKFGIEATDVKTEAAKTAREDLLVGDEKRRRAARIIEKLQDRRLKANPQEFILGKTVIFDKSTKELVPT